jgi:hypothetical protein
MDIPDYVKKGARELVEQGVNLPALIHGSAEFYVALEGDDAIVGFKEIKIGVVNYKIGTKK